MNREPERALPVNPEPRTRMSLSASVQHLALRVLRFALRVLRFGFAFCALQGGRGGRGIRPRVCALAREDDRVLYCQP